MQHRWGRAADAPGPRVIDQVRRHSPAAQRNAAPILAMLRTVLPPSGLVLEIASGSGEHAVHFAQALPGLVWQPSDAEAGARASIAAWRSAEGSPNLRAPLDLDAAATPWPIARADAILCINMIHISPWSAAVGLMRNAAALLMAGSPLILYGPFRQKGVATAPSNEAFDTSLRERDPAWGLRALEDVAACAGDHGFGLDRVIAMPANNLSAIFRKA